MRKEKEALKIAAEEVENVALEKYRKIEEEIKQKEQEEEKRASEQEAFEHFHKLDANQDGKWVCLPLHSLGTHHWGGGEVVSAWSQPFISIEH